MDRDTLWYPSRLDVYLNLWFANYEEARHARETEGGYLLPYKKHFFICPRERSGASVSTPTILIGSD